MALVSPLTSLLNTAVKKAANALIRDFNEIEKLQSSVKDYKPFVLNAYGKVERALKIELGKIKPDFAFYEEGKAIPNGPHFVVAPIDGLDNFAHGSTQFSISVAICDGSTIIAGAVYSPITDELFFAERGKGAYKDGARAAERLRVSSRKDLKDSIISTLVYHKDLKEYFSIANTLVEETGNLRIYGAVSLDLSYVASGKLDAAISLNNNYKEIAAGLLIVKEAGGYIYDIHQKDFDSGKLDEVVASGNLMAVNANLNKKLYNALNKK